MSRTGFTLIELIIVVIIIGILASIAAPMMSGMKSKAICAEAVTAMGAIRTAMMTYYVEHNAWPNINDYAVNLSAALQGMGLSPADLTGSYFSVDCYYISPNCIYVSPFPDCISSGGHGMINHATRANETSTILDDSTNHDSWLWMCVDPTVNVGYPAGTIRQHNISRSGYKSM